MNYCRSLKFEEKPDIGYLRKLFKDLFYRMGYEYDFVFDWMVKKQNPSASMRVGEGEEGKKEDGVTQDQIAQDPSSAMQ
jgi:hypothetical protein